MDAAHRHDLGTEWRAAAAALLSAYIRKHQDHLETLRDPDLGAVGQHMRAQIDALGCMEEYNQAAKASLLGGFFNKRIVHTGAKPRYNTVPTILYTPSAFTDPSMFFTTRTHEYIHALQYRKAPVLQTGPLSPLCLHPEDSLRCHALAERDAYAKEKWLALLSRDDHMSATGVRARHGDGTGFDINREIFGLHQSLMIEAEGCDYTVFQVTRADGTCRQQDFLSYHGDTELDNFESQQKAARQARLSPVYVRAEADDLYLIGTSFGPNSLGRDRLNDKYNASPPLSDAQRKRLGALCADARIPDRKDLPTFKEALSERGLTPERYSRMLHEDTGFKARGRASAPRSYQG